MNGTNCISFINGGRCSDKRIRRIPNFMGDRLCILWNNISVTCHLYHKKEHEDNEHKIDKTLL